MLPCVPQGHLQSLICPASDSPSCIAVSSEVSPDLDMDHQGWQVLPSTLVPTACSRGSSKVIQWIVSIFHAFKAQLVPQAISQETGWALPSYVKLYQNNMLVHFWSQQAQSKAKPKPTPYQTIWPLSGHPPLHSHSQGQL